MLEDIRNSSTAARLLAIVAAAVLSFALFGLYSLNTLHEVKVDGGHYRRIVQGKDLIADILPPPACLMETYVTALQMVEDESGRELPVLVERFQKLESGYRARHDFWLKDLPDGELKRVFLDKSYVPGLRMLDSIERGLIPALRSGDRQYARELLRGTIRKDYEEHRSHIDEVVDMATRRMEELFARLARGVDA